MAFEIVVVGTSLGGLEALRVVLGGLPADFPLPVAVVQHRQASSGDELVQLLDPHSRLPLGEVEDKEGIAPWLASLCRRPAGSP